MTKHHLRFSPRLWLGMAAATGLTLTMSTPAPAETIDLICQYANSDSNLHVSIDTDRQSVVHIADDKRYGPYAASISDTIIRWTEIPGNGNEFQYTIDRVAGTMTDTRFYLGEQKMDLRGQCRRATQKF